MVVVPLTVAAVKSMSPTPALPMPSVAVRVSVPLGTTSRSFSSLVPSMMASAFTVRLPLGLVTVVPRVSVVSLCSTNVPVPCTTTAPPVLPMKPPARLRVEVLPAVVVRLRPPRPALSGLCSCQLLSPLMRTSAVPLVRVNIGVPVVPALPPTLRRR